MVLEKAVIFASKNNELVPKKWNDQRVHFSSVFLNDCMVVKTFLETMELLHVDLT
jgi:hypothetical protein